VCSAGLYTGGARVRGAAFVQKPFAAEEVVEVVRGALAARA
jgi:hypothetical protein